MKLRIRKESSTEDQGKIIRRQWHNWIGVVQPAGIGDENLAFY